ncbi:MAG TPA: bile acid:sodium symporter [Sphingopyxis sp.]|jgi:BASS family bile acid:Na+ symporter|uniref:bile acid:sodium symporter family protein n=1 Tax=Sphingopyxis sp. TaxID=1908224 RepID=UPI002CC23418|nr:bile acid:sodium symporter [Sphingopyxis sp.]HWV59641.1 bile acid:sodium symporter [Sphingopyxis sp.]HWW56598.1 bile acid:sodium symporter [Sphingopyxis sp.]
MTYDDLMSLLGNWLLPGSLVAIMVSMGLSLTADDFRQVFRNKRALIFGVCSMLIVPPLIGLSLALTVAPTAALAVGFVLLATTPGGMLSNLFTDMAKGDLALSMSMTLILSMIYIFVVPFYAHFALLHFMGLEADVQVPLASFFWDIFSITVLPATVGFAVRAWRPDFAIWFKRYLKNAATIVLFSSFGVILYDQVPVLRENLGALFWITVALNLIMVVVVMTIVRFAGFTRRENVAIGIEHLMRQEGTAIFIAVSIVGNNEMSLPMIMNTPVALCFVLLFVAIARRTGRPAQGAPATI